LASQLTKTKQNESLYCLDFDGFNFVDVVYKQRIWTSLFFQQKLGFNIHVGCVKTIDLASNM
jgi:hypothetical protein